MAHGEFGRWLESIEIKWDTANRLMRITSEFDANYVSGRNIGIKALYEIAQIPPEQREQPHTLASGETKTVDEMTVRELREVKAELKKATEKAEQAETARQLAEHKAQ